MIVAGCFGKAPVAADFISHNAGSGAPYELQRWLLDGATLAREQTGSRWKPLYAALTPRRLRFAPEGGGVLAGALARGVDRSGREFPFTTFLVLNGGEESGPALSVLEEEAAAMAALEGVAVRASARDGSPGYPTLEELKRAVEEAAATPGNPPPGLDRRRGTTAGALNRGLGLDGLVGRATANLVELAHRTARWEHWLPDFALRFPLPAPGELREAACGFWIRLAVTALRARTAPSAFWPGDADLGTGSLDLYFQPPPPVAFLYLLDPARKGDAVYPVHEEEAPRLYLGGRPDAAAPLSDETASLTEILDRTAAHRPGRS